MTGLELENFYKTDDERYILNKNNDYLFDLVFYLNITLLFNKRFKINTIVKKIINMICVQS